ncbi:Hypothetical protein BHY_0656 [Borrelia nietonii YOR]|uniref:Uncharacterized protein n=1 Tax=Borrelia nietonii YOR TaxID=1293576 RepID=A0ABM5PHR4_9SPIR|nr:MULTISPECIES: hypothetical protein [Borrelia]AHH03607.1 Hypothetical protein BHY_0656 [Borrelia nietonii YOR]AHH14112.1 Hypothetical protein BHW_0053800 [Borrelia hermsii MTW]UPA09306.1 hypothetical protein bhYOR_000616 [Borrelia nietonii YOR]
MKDGVRKPSGSRVSFNSQDHIKNVVKNNFSSFSNSNFGKSFTKKKKGK